jgi:hypothetical protein
MAPTEKLAGLRQARSAGGHTGQGPGARPTAERRWTGIEPARRGSPVSAALKAVGPTRRPDTSDEEASALSAGPGPRVGLSPMKKLLLLAVLVALGVVAAKKVKGAN